jgi:NADH dehydrogenase
MNKQNILILGAGYAGIKAAQNLSKKFKNDSSTEITLIDQNNYHTLLTEIHEVAGNRINPDSAKISLSNIFADTKVNLVKDKITNIDREEQIVSSDNQDYNYDYLVMGVGSEPTYFNIPGLKEHSFSLWSLEDAQQINNHIRKMFQLAAQESNLAKRKELLTFLIGGGGFTGVETAGEIAEWIDELCQQYDIPKQEVDIKLIEAQDGILPTLSQKRIEVAEEYLTNQLGVEILTTSAICRVEEDSVYIDYCTAEDDTVVNNEEPQESDIISSRTLIWNGGIKANQLVEDTGLELEDRNRIAVNKHLQTSDPKIYAIGDNSHFETENNSSLPQIVEAAIQAGECAAENIYAQINDQELEEFNQNLHGVVASLGANYAVAEFKITSSITLPLIGFLAMLSKHMINFHYLFSVTGFQGIFDYINHQFKDVKGGVGMLIRHLSKKSATFWLVLLRIALGVRFLLEGVNKIQKGWLFSSESFLISGASSVLWSEGTPQWFVDFAKAFIGPNQVIFQKVIVLTELAIAFSMIFGFLTIFGALASMALSANFIMGSIGNYPAIWEPIWLFIISLVMLSGAGKAFGVDYYLIPWLFNLSKYNPNYKQD